MSNPPNDSSSPDPLEPVLRDVEAQLKQRLREACEAEASGVPSDATAEIRRLEDVLLKAAVAAEQTIALRQHMEARKTAREESGAESPRLDAPNVPAEPILRVREFRDAAGQLWRAWPVTPGPAREGRTAQRYLGEFQKGWICFEALESTARRRLPQQPADWAELPESELQRLLEQAISAPERKDRPAIRKPVGPPVN